MIAGDGTLPILCLGEILVDLIVDDGAPDLVSAGRFVARDGGAPANAAVALAKLGVPAAFRGVVGDDPFGDRLRATLSRHGVNVSGLRSAPGAATTLAFAWKDARGDGHFRLLRLADALLDQTDIATAGIERGRVAALVVGSVSLAAEPSRQAIASAVELAATAGVPICFDVNMRPTLWPDRSAAAAACAPILERATLLKLSLDDARFLFDAGDDPERALDQIAALGAPFVVLTDGSRGAWFAGSRVAASADRHVPAIPVRAVEPTGAGDAFTAATISRLRDRQWTTLIGDDLRFAAAAGALTTTKPGAMDSLPTHAEVASFLERSTTLA